MRLRLILVNAAIVLMVGILSYSVMLQVLPEALGSIAKQRAAAERAVSSATTQLALDGFAVHEWAQRQAAAPSVASIYRRGTGEARAEAASAEARRLLDAAVQEEVFQDMAPTRVLFVDREGVVIGGNDSQMMRGENIGADYPSLHKALSSRSQRVGAVWLNHRRQEQLLTTVAPVQGAAGLLGALIVCTPLNDHRLERTSMRTSAEPLLLLVKRAGSWELAAQTRASRGVRDWTKKQQSQLGQIVDQSHYARLENAPLDMIIGGSPLLHYSGGPAVVLTAVPSHAVGGLKQKLWPVLGVTGLGLLFVFVAGLALASYIQRPIQELEEGLLTVINGRTELRFELDHPELGGLVDRINTLLNRLTKLPDVRDGMDDD